MLQNYSSTLLDPDPNPGPLQNLDPPLVKIFILIYPGFFFFHFFCITLRTNKLTKAQTLLVEVMNCCGCMFILQPLERGRHLQYRLCVCLLLSQRFPPWTVGRTCLFIIVFDWQLLAEEGKYIVFTVKPENGS